jgi:hypothetical protein
MKKVALFITFSLLYFHQNQAQVLSNGNALNVAGKQRMLVERVAKDFIFKSLEVQKEKATKEQISSTLLFEEHLNALEAYAPNEQIKEKIKTVKKGWTEFKSVLNYKTMDKQTASYVFQESDKILKRCDDVVNAIVVHIIQQKSSFDKTSLKKEMITTHTNSSGKMRMLIQRTALYYVSYAYGITQDFHYEELTKTADLIQFSLNEVKDSPLNDKETNDAIDGVFTEWKTFTDAFLKEGKFDFTSKKIKPEVIFDFSNKMVSKIDKITLAYAKMLDN